MQVLILLKVKIHQTKTNSSLCYFSIKIWIGFLSVHLLFTNTQVLNDVLMLTGAGANAFCQHKADGLYSDPKDCGMFYQCDMNLGFHEPCPPGLAFNEPMAECDYPYKVPQCTHYHHP